MSGWRRPSPAYFPVLLTEFSAISCSEGTACQSSTSVDRRRLSGSRQFRPYSGRCPLPPARAPRFPSPAREVATPSPSAPSARPSAGACTSAPRPPKSRSLPDSTAVSKEHSRSATPWLTSSLRSRTYRSRWSAWVAACVLGCPSVPRRQVPIRPRVPHRPGRLWRPLQQFRVERAQPDRRCEVPGVPPVEALSELHP
jgi:hypothetical protein